MSIITLCSVCMCSDNSSVHLTVDFLDSRQKNNLMTCLHFIRINCRQESARLYIHVTITKTFTQTLFSVLAWASGTETKSRPAFS